MSDTPLTDEQLMEIALHGTLDGVDLAKPGTDQTFVTISGHRVAELKLLAARAEASLDASLTNVRYTSVRGVHLQAEQDRGAPIRPFSMFAVSVVDPTVPFGKGVVKDVMFCRTPEIAKFIVALLDFGSDIVAECGISDTPA